MRKMLIFKSDELIEFLNENKTFRLGGDNGKDVPRYSYTEFTIDSLGTFIEIEFHAFAQRYDETNCAFLMGQEFQKWKEARQNKPKI